MTTVGGSNCVVKCDIGTGYDSNRDSQFIQFRYYSSESTLTPVTGRLIEARFARVYDAVCGRHIGTPVPEAVQCVDREIIATIQFVEFGQ